MITMHTNDESATAMLSDLPKRIQMQAILRRVGVRLINDYRRNMRKGVDADGKALPAVQRWARMAGSARGRSQAVGGMIPLRSTGTMEKSFDILALNESVVKVGFMGEQAEKAKKQQFGIASMMTLAEKGRRGWYSGILVSQKGNKYFRAKTNDGQWFSRRITGNQTTVKPRARPFLWISRTQLNTIQDVMTTEINKAVERESARQGGTI